LKNNLSLKSINLSKNEIKDGGVIALAEALKSLSLLRNIDLSNNQIGVLGARTLVEALKNSTSLRMLDLSGNLMEDESLAEITEELNLD